MIYNGMKLGFMVGYFPDGDNVKENYNDPTIFMQFQAADYEYDEVIKFSDGDDMPIILVRTVYDIGGDYVRFDALINFNSVDRPFNAVLLVKYDLETDTWCVLYEKIALKCWIPDKTKNILTMTVRRELLNIDKIQREIFEVDSLPYY